MSENKKPTALDEGVWILNWFNKYCTETWEENTVTLTVSIPHHPVWQRFIVGETFRFLNSLRKIDKKRDIIIKFKVTPKLTLTLYAFGESLYDRTSVSDSDAVMLTA